mmetsp:Transcript_12804/g.34029  ORF Transcript_12804/g.34029 Transcript_12804/m.34029 type:complete len:203 (-) Transcript_12804:201-809(-)
MLAAKLTDPRSSRFSIPRHHNLLAVREINLRERRQVKPWWNVCHAFVLHEREQLFPLEVLLDDNLIVIQLEIFAQVLLGKFSLAPQNVIQSFIGQLHYPLHLLREVAQITRYWPIVFPRYHEGIEELGRSALRLQDNSVAIERLPKAFRPVHVVPDVQHGLVIAELVREVDVCLLRGPHFQIGVKLVCVADRRVKNVWALLP